MNTQLINAPNIADPVRRDQFNVLLWTSLAGLVLGLPSPNKSA